MFIAPNRNHVGKPKSYSAAEIQKLSTEACGLIEKQSSKGDKETIALRYMDEFRGSDAAGGIATRYLFDSERVWNGPQLMKVLAQTLPPDPTQALATVFEGLAPKMGHQTGDFVRVIAKESDLTRGEQSVLSTPYYIHKGESAKAISIIADGVPENPLEAAVSVLERGQHSFGFDMIERNFKTDPYLQSVAKLGNKLVRGRTDHRSEQPTSMLTELVRNGLQKDGSENAVARKELLNYADRSLAEAVQKGEEVKLSLIHI